MICDNCRLEIVRCADHCVLGHKHVQSNTHFCDVAQSGKTLADFLRDAEPGALRIQRTAKPMEANS